ncbi:hypothetical protein EDC96DRAFT_582295 [Choanephora cucurbitarum]|nr:hypothetical protein EDC96DRAFT_582295 [Choanephora cucurbitarum]
MNNLMAKPKYFSGYYHEQEDSACIWLNSMERRRRALNWSDEEVIGEASTFLTGTASDWWKVIEEQARTWDDFKKKFEEQFIIESRVNSKNEGVVTVSDGVSTTQSVQIKKKDLSSLNPPSMHGKKRKTKEVVCYVCKEKGHISRNCSNRRSNVTMQPVFSSFKPVLIERNTKTTYPSCRSNDTIQSVPPTLKPTEYINLKTECASLKVEGVTHMIECVAHKAECVSLRTDDSADLKTNGVADKAKVVSLKTNNDADKAISVAEKTNNVADKAIGVVVKTESVAVKVEGVDFKVNGVISKVEGGVLKTKVASSKDNDVAHKTECVAFKAEKVSRNTKGTALKDEGAMLKTKGVTHKVEDVTLRTKDSAFKEKDVALKIEKGAFIVEDGSLEAEYDIPKVKGVPFKAESVVLKTEDITRKAELNECKSSGGIEDVRIEVFKALGRDMTNAEAIVLSWCTNYFIECLVITSMSTVLRSSGLGIRVDRGELPRNEGIGVC